MRQTADTYCWIELAAMLSDRKMVRGKYVHIQDEGAIRRFCKKYHHIDLFVSVARYEKPDNGSRFIAPLYFDIDAKNDLNGARENAIMLCEMLCDRIGIDHESIEKYFSGYKGFHIIVPVEVICPRHSEHSLNLLKVMAQRAQAIGVDHLDSTVYTRKRILRLPNSVHSKSQSYKIPLTYKELRDTNIKAILELAQKPRPDDSYAKLEQDAQAGEWYKKAIRVMEQRSVGFQSETFSQQSFRKGWRKPPCIRNIEKTVIPEGLRHNLYYQLSRYYAWIGMHPEGIIEQIEEINASNPIEDPEYIARMVMSGIQKPGFPGCQNPGLIKFCNKDICFVVRIKDYHAKSRE